MLQQVKEVGYSAYTPVTIQKTVEADKKIVETKTFQLQEVLEQIKDYTYTQQDAKQVDKEVVKQLQSQFDLKEEDVYELHKRGFNVEYLLLEDAHSMIKLDKENEEKEETLKKVKDQLNVIKQGSDSMYLNALMNKEPITINSLYANYFKGDLKKTNAQPSKSDVISVLQMNGLSHNEGNTWAAQALMSCGMDVNKEMVMKLQNIKAAVNALDPDIEIDGNKELVKNNEIQYESYHIDRITDDLGMVTDEHIEKLIEEGKTINITHLRESIYKNTSAILKEQQVARPVAVEAREVSLEEGQIIDEVDGLQNQETSQVVAQVKDQINQIRTKLTVEAAQKISGKLPLESAELSNVAKELQQLQEEKVIGAFKQVGLEPNEVQIAETIQVLDTITAMKHYPMETVGIELKSEETVVLSEINAALKAYGENETPAQKRFGETIKKVEDQIEGLLKAQGIEVTAVTTQAAKALITNGMEVNLEHIEPVMALVTKLNTFLEEMTPVQVAAYIKEGMNPYDASVDTLLNWMSSEKLEGLKVSVAETIVALEEKKQINKEQKEIMIGLYRILQGVTKHQEEVVGYVFKNQLPLTIEKLQEATRYIHEKNHIQVEVGDEFGELENLLYDKSSAKELMSEKSEQNGKTVQLIKQLEAMELPVSESNINKLNKISALLYPYIKEQFKKEIGAFDGLSTLPKHFLDKLEAVQNVAPELIERMIEQKVPLTLSHIYWMDKIVHEPMTYGELLNEAGVLKEELPERLSEIEEALLKVEEKAKKEQEVATLSGDLLKYKQYKELQEVSCLQRQLMDKEGLYQLPFIINGEQRLVNLYIHKQSHQSVESNQHTKAIISYQTKHLGLVKAYVEIKGDHIGYRIEGENENMTSKLEAYSGKLMALLSQIGYEVKYTDYRVKEKEIQETQSFIKRDDSQFEEMI